MAKKTTPKKRNSSTASVSVKKGNEVLVSAQNFLTRNLHDRFNISLSKRIQTQLVAFGPWLSIALVLVILPELLVFAKNGMLITFSGFFETIVFNQEAWVVLLVILSGLMLLVDGIGDLFNKKLRGWQRIYLATLINTGYILWQLPGNMDNLAAPILSLLVAFIIIFAQLDIKKYYK